MQWMTMTSFVPCHALHAPQHAAASPFGPLNHSNDFFCPSCRSRLYITGTGKSRYAGFCLELPTPRWIADHWFILRGDLLYVFPCVILFLCFSVLLVLRLTRLGKRELIFVLFVRLFGLCLFGFVGFLFLLGSGKGCGL